MTTTLIPRPAALLKLLAHGALTHDDCLRITGWPDDELKTIVKELRARGRLGYLMQPSPSRRMYRLGQHSSSKSRREKARRLARAKARAAA
ncbi:hypothetical protein [Variovorax sp. dw_954]|uniref:hypothetical protein n=1 Tax=Variovorax sp. dw_954 TaxID=2720078 RepID=UPI001BD478C7|nr:hypothetical protein [Variovorax sp. dw_954]